MCNFEFRLEQKLTLSIDKLHYLVKYTILITILLQMMFGILKSYCPLNNLLLLITLYFLRSDFFVEPALF